MIAPAFIIIYEFRIRIRRLGMRTMELLKEQFYALEVEGRTRCAIPLMRSEKWWRSICDETFRKKTFGDLDRFDELSGLKPTWREDRKAISLVTPRADVFRHIPLFERLTFSMYLYEAINAQTTDTQATLAGVAFYDLLSQSTPCDEHFKVFFSFCFEDDKSKPQFALIKPLRGRYHKILINKHDDCVSTREAPLQ